MLLMICRKYKKAKYIFTRLLNNFTWLPLNKIQISGRQLNFICNALECRDCSKENSGSLSWGKGMGTSAELREKYRTIASVSLLRKFQ